MKALKVVFAVLLAIGSLGGVVGAIALVVSLFATHGIVAGIVGIVLIPVAALVFPIYFVVFQGVWWPLLWYPVCVTGGLGAWATSRQGHT